MTLNPETWSRRSKDKNKRKIKRACLAALEVRGSPSVGPEQGWGGGGWIRSSQGSDSRTSSRVNESLLHSRRELSDHTLHLGSGGFPPPPPPPRGTVQLCLDMFSVLTNEGERVFVLASGGRSPWALLSIPQCTRQPRTDNDLVQNAESVR